MLNLIAGLIVAGTTTYYGRKIMAAIDNLRREVAETRDLASSAVTLVNGLSQQLRDLAASGATEEDIQSLADELDAAAQPLAAAIMENTPSQGGGDTGGETPAPTPPTPVDEGGNPLPTTDEGGNPINQPLDPMGRRLR